MEATWEKILRDRLWQRRFNVIKFVSAIRDSSFIEILDGMEGRSGSGSVNGSVSVRKEGLLPELSVVES